MNANSKYIEIVFEIICVVKYSASSPVTLAVKLGNLLVAHLKHKVSADRYLFIAAKPRKENQIKYLF